MGRSLARWRALTGRQKSQLALLALALPMVGVLLRLRGFQKASQTCARIGGQAPLRRPTPQDLEDAQAFATLAGIAGRRSPVTTTCLRQALVVQAWLRRRGLDAQLKVGVKKNGEALDAHAWVELDGTPLAQPNLTHAPFPAPDLAAKRPPL